MGVVHRYSSHHYMLRYWLASSGVDVDKEVEIVTIAPPFAADALAAGEVDGICVGEPWNSVAVDKGVGAIVTVTSHIWQRGVEKVLAMPTERMESERDLVRSEEHTSELQSLMRISYAVFCLKKKTNTTNTL